MKKYIFLVVIWLFVSCSQDFPTVQDFPVIRTLEVVEADESGATFRAEVLETGRIPTTSYGFVWEVANPDIRTSHEIVLGHQLGSGPIQAKIEHALIEGLIYNIRAFATYSGKTVYGNTVILKSEGSRKSCWSLKRTGIELEGYFSSYGSANLQHGYVIFQSAECYIFDPEELSFSESRRFPSTGSSGTEFKSILVGNTQYFLSSSNPNLCRLEEDIWTIQSRLPFHFFSRSHGHALSDNLFIFSANQSYMYDLATDTWQRKAAVPVGTGRITGGVSLGERAFILTSEKELLEYNVDSDTWLPKTLYPGRLGGEIISFADQHKIYFGLSSRFAHAEKGEQDNHLWSYDPVKDKWEAQEPFPDHLNHDNLFYFALNNKLYIGDKLQKYRYRLWTFDPSKK